MPINAKGNGRSYRDCYTDTPGYEIVPLTPRVQFRKELRVLVILAVWIVNEEVLGDAMSYIMKYIEKSGERIVYYGDLPQFFVSDVMENDILCPYGEDGQKFILSDTFGCWDEGEYIGQVSKETIAKLPKVK